MQMHAYFCNVTLSTLLYKIDVALIPILVTRCGQTEVLRGRLERDGTGPIPVFYVSCLQLMPPHQPASRVTPRVPASSPQTLQPRRSRFERHLARSGQRAGTRPVRQRSRMVERLKTAGAATGGGRVSAEAGEDLWLSGIRGIRVLASPARLSTPVDIGQQAPPQESKIRFHVINVRGMAHWSLTAGASFAADGALPLSSQRARGSRPSRFVGKRRTPETPLPRRKRRSAMAVVLQAPT